MPKRISEVIGISEEKLAEGLEKRMRLKLEL